MITCPLFYLIGPINIWDRHPFFVNEILNDSFLYDIRRILLDKIVMRLDT